MVPSGDEINIVLEAIRLVFALAVFVLVLSARRGLHHERQGWRFVQGGFLLFAFASALDLTDNFPALNVFVVIGDTPVEAFLEKVVGYLGGLLFLFIGFWRWLNVVEGEGTAGERLSQLEQSSGDLIESRESYRRLVDLSPDGILVHRDGTIRYANESIRDLLGVRDTSLLIGTPVLDLVHPDDRELAAARMKMIREGAERLPAAIMRLARRDGGWVPIEVVGGETVFEGEKAHQSVIRDATVRNEVEEALRKNERRYRDFAEASSDWFWEMDSELRFSFFSDQATLHTGLPVSKLIGKRRQDFAETDSADPNWARHFADLEAHRPFKDFVYDLRDQSRRLRTIRISGVPLFDRSGGFAGYRGVGTDVTAEREATDRLTEKELQFRAALETSPVAVLIGRVADRRVVFHNSRAGDMFGQDGSVLVGRDIGRVVAGVEEREGVLRALNADGRVSDVEVPGARGDGGTVPILLSVERFVYEGVDAEVWWAYDISAQVAARERLAELANRDELTGLPNRRLFGDQLTHGITRAKRQKTALAVLYCDLDGFKDINDTYGHDYGDQLLLQASHRIRGGVRETDVIARVGLDQFAVMLEDLKGTSGAQVVAEKILYDLARSYQRSSGDGVHLGCSIGIAYFERGEDGAGEDADALIARAARVMTRAKRAGKGVFRVYDSGMDG